MFLQLQLWKNTTSKDYINNILNLVFFYLVWAFYNNYNIYNPCNIFLYDIFLFFFFVYFFCTFLIIFSISKSFALFLLLIVLFFLFWLQKWAIFTNVWVAKKWFSNSSKFNIITLVFFIFSLSNHLFIVFFLL